MPVIDYTDRKRMRLDVEFYFAAAHRLPRYEGPCFRLHGHNYKMFVSVEGEVDPKTGMIFDFGVLKQVVSRVDHRNLNDVLDNPTAENIARWVWETLGPHLPGLCEVRLYEIPDCCVTYRGPGGR
jgi:6-pyruvoyltetrahydropterin/6-carboxytetrahydropterin synthase